jgi:salicylate hydroxylase
LYVYTCPLGDDDFEVTARIRRNIAAENQVSWGRRFHLPDLLPEFDEFCVAVRDILRLAAEGETQEFALLAGPRLHRMTTNKNIAFIGDAAHAFCGNFGAGTGFALEDVYTLGKCLTWANDRGHRPAKALELYNQIRSPHYERLNEVLKKFASIKSRLNSECLSVDEEIEARIIRIAEASETWMYYYNIEDDVEDKLKEATVLMKPTATSGAARCVYL